MQIKKNAAVIVTLAVLTPPVLYWVAVYVVGIARGHLLLGTPVVLAALVICRFFTDNRRLLSAGQLFRFFPLALVYYLPVALVVMPALLLTRKAEDLMYVYSAQLHDKCQDQVTSVTKSVEKRVLEMREKDDSVLYKPWTWGNKVHYFVEVAKMEMVTELVTKKASMAARAMYGSLVSILDNIVIAIRIMEVVLIGTSFFYVYSQLVVGRSGLRTIF